MINLPDFSRAKVLVVGDVMLDNYWHGATSRISPEAPVPVVRIERQEARPGGAGNVALNIVALGAEAKLAGLIGDDAAADQLRGLLTARGVECALMRVAGSHTITKLRVISRHQQVIRLDFEDHFPGFDSSGMFADFSAMASDYDVMILSDYAKGVLRQPESLIAAARAAGKPVVIDPKGQEFERYRGATVITPNMSEFEAVVGHCADVADIERRGAELRDALDLEAVLITRSEKGMSLLARGHPPLHLPTQAQDVFDVTGAGDTVVATLGAALAAGLSLPDAVALSNIAAGIVVAKLGTATVNTQELRWALRGESPTASRGSCNEEELLARMSVARGKGERIVMTNGCFDILHPGHIDYLEKARALGDRLIVAVNDDDSVRRLKGVSRPVNPLATRMRMLSALASVDWVVSFAEDTPQRLLGKLLPDILVKGGDYREDQVAGGAEVKAAGGQVRILNFVDGHSTTALIDKIQRQAS
jgi:D-beta-D-heptose 7-phosphate kinase/D-beta-D-heptose 1-phosphate adenosyltransferase